MSVRHGSEPVSNVCSPETQAADLRCPSICLLNLFCDFYQEADNMAVQSCHKMIMDSEACFVRQSSSPEDDRRAFRHRYTGLPSDEP